MSYGRPRAVALLFGLVLCSRAATAEPEGDARAPKAGPSNTDADAAAQAKRFYDNGRKLAEIGKWDEAYAEFRTAYTWLDHWQIAQALGDSAYALGKYPEAIEALSRYLEKAPNVSPPERHDIEARLMKAKENCGLLEVSAPAGYEVRIDSSVRGKTPLKEDVYALAGPHTIEVVTPSGTVKRAVVIKAGETSSVIVNETESGSKASPPGNAATSRPRSILPVVAGGAVAGAALVTGAILFSVSTDKHGEAIAAKRDFDAGRPGTTAKDVGDLLRAQDALITGAIGSFIGAAVLGGATIGYYLYFVRSPGQPKREDGPPKAQTAIVLSPTVSPTRAGIVIQGSF